MNLIFGKQFIPNTNTNSNRLFNPISIIASPSNSVLLHKQFPALQLSCITESCSSSTSPNEPYPSSSTIVFVKGLPLATTEGSLIKAFSQFGELTRGVAERLLNCVDISVKIVMNKKTKQSLGSAFVWFSSQESAQEAVNYMNGKFFEGRFISVLISKPGSCKIQERARPYKF